MGVITRSEAAYRLKQVSSAVNEAVTFARQGDWAWAEDAAQRAEEVLSKLLPHISEAAAAEPPIKRAEPEPIGSLYGTPPPPLPKSRSNGTRQEVHVVDRTPPVPIILPKRKAAIITPPPPTPIIVPPPAPEVRVFDPSLISGQLANFQRVKADPTAHVDWEMTEAFDLLTPEAQERIARKYQATKQPVNLDEL